MQSITSQKFEEAADLRDMERKLQESLDKEKRKWEEQAQ